MIAEPTFSELPIQSGIFSHDQATHGGWPLSSGEGSRAHLVPVNFTKAFKKVPVVIAFIAGVEIAYDYDHRLSVEAVNVAQDNFMLKIGTWSDTKVLGCDIAWIAFDADLANAADSRIQVGRRGWKCKSTPGWHLDGGNGDRSFRDTIRFDHAYSYTPSIFTAFALIDIVNEDDHRLSLVPEDPTPSGFKVHLSTWSNSKIWSSHIAWIAFDPAFGRGIHDVQMFCGRHPFKKMIAGYNLHEGQGLRSITQHVNFPKKFASESSVVTGLCVIDLLHDEDERVRLTTANKTDAGFDLQLSTWNKSCIWGASGCWIAHGPAQNASPATKRPLDAAEEAAKKAKNDVSPAPAVSPAAAAAAPPPPAAAAVSSASAEAPAAASSTPAAKPAAKKKDDDDENMCKICYDGKINTVIIPCGHLALCIGCSKMFQGPGHKKECPICKSKITKIIQTFST